MIRLPPSSISLSEHDIQSHLAHLHLYQNLLKQGFKQGDARRYVHEYQQRRADNHAVDNEVPSYESESTVALRLKWFPDEVGVVAPAAVRSIARQDDGVKDECPATDLAGTRTETGRRSSESNNGCQPLVNPAGLLEEPQRRISSLSTHQHAPRQSSLLRFAKAISPESVSSNESIQFAAVRSPRTYRPRTETLSYQESEPYVDDLEDTEIALRLSDLAITDSPNVQIHPSSVSGSRSSLRASAETFVPFRLPPPFSSTNRRAPSQASLPLSGISLGTVSRDYRAEPITNRDFDASTPQQDSSPIDDTTFYSAEPTSTDLPSSPPIPNTLIEGRPSAARGSTLSSEAPVTPIRSRPSRATRTEPRNQRELYQYFDGTSFAVFNDSLPSSSQPQTPADLARRQLITEFDAAYTAPPGMIHNTPLPRTVGHSQEEQDTIFGEQSPTMRAMSVRTRRNREWIRSTRFWTELRRRDEQRARAEADQNGAGNLTDPRIELWRDELGRDRLGEENFGLLDDPEPARTRSTIRVVSGNAARWTIAGRRD